MREDFEPRMITDDKGQGLLSACDPSPLLFTHELFYGETLNFPSRRCFQHKHTKAVILPALKTLSRIRSSHS